MTFKDNRPVILEKDLDKIFNRYERINTSINLCGLGLGLYISKQIVEAHGGKIKVESIVDRGTKFLVTLPAFV